ncbi:hypothetical protein [Methylobacterium sp. CCH5-D2]|uniref:hypothetical protein n=1 Tax=Methylobacterium sp. CCH5-D2 TaxID=1768765 RepID=UPI00082B433D|nr:hypothetical protein [Methylobacterium sp. CCH5-D2]
MVASESSGRGGADEQGKARGMKGRAPARLRNAQFQRGETGHARTVPATPKASAQADAVTAGKADRGEGCRAFSAHARHAGSAQGGRVIPALALVEVVRREGRVLVLRGIPKGGRSIEAPPEVSGENALAGNVDAGNGIVLVQGRRHAALAVATPEETRR